MDKKKLLTDVGVKQESNSSTSKKVLLSSSSFVSLSGKSVSSARLPSFKPPRDLFLTGTVVNSQQPTFNFNSGTKSTRKTFTPNLHVTRKKDSSDSSTTENICDVNLKNKEREKNKKVPSTRKRCANVVQTKGIFSEGLAPGKIKVYSSTSGERGYNECHALDKPKLNLNKKIHKTDEDSKLKSLLQDNFIADPSHIPDITFVPKSLPMIYTVKSCENSDDLERTFEMLQVKAENSSASGTGKPGLELEFDQGQGPKMLLFEFPSKLSDDESGSVKSIHKTPKQGSESDRPETDEKSEALSSLGEGFFGYLRIHKNGRAFLVTGKTRIPLCLNRHGTNQEVMSASIHCGAMKGEVIRLGSVEASFTCSANIFHRGEIHQKCN